MIAAEKEEGAIESSRPLYLSVGQREAITSIAYLIAIASAELVGGLVGPLGGIVFHIVVLCVLLTHASVASPNPAYKLYLSLSLVPLIRIVSLSVPLSAFSQVTWYMIVAVPLLAAGLMVVGILKYSGSDIYLTRGKLPIQLLVGVTGIGFGLVQYYILSPDPLIDALTFQAILLPAFILLIATGFTEEFIFRGIIQRSSLAVLGPRGLFYVAGIFAAIHITNLSLAQVGVVFLIGLFFCWIAKRTGSLLGVTLSHGITNITLYLVFPFIL